MREKFWEELNEARSKNEVKLWKEIFPEAKMVSAKIYLLLFNF